MDVNKSISWAQRIFKELPSNIGKTEFSRFFEYLREHDFDSAMEFLRVQKDSKLLRRKQKKDYKKFYITIEKYEEPLHLMSKQEILEIFSYVAWQIKTKK